MNETTKPEISTRFRAGAAARWMPRIVGGSILAAAMLIVLDLDPEGRVPYSGLVKAVVLTAAAAGSLWVIRRGSEARLQVVVERRALRFSQGRRSVELPWDDLEALDYDPPFSTPAGWLPAMVLVDGRGRRWRIPTVIDPSAGLLGTILDRCPHEEVRSWAEVRAVGPRVRRAWLFVAAGYCLAALIFVAAVIHVYR